MDLVAGPRVFPWLGSSGGSEHDNAEHTKNRDANAFPELLLTTLFEGERGSRAPVPGSRRPGGGCSLLPVAPNVRRPKVSTVVRAPLSARHRMLDLPCSSMPRSAVVLEEHFAPAQVTAPTCAVEDSSQLLG